MKNSYFKTFVSGILAGASIAIGGTVFLALDNKVLGAVFFCAGLFTVCTFGFSLFTGKVCYLFENDKSYAIGLIPMWLGNLVGSLIIGGLVLASRLGPSLSAKAAGICDTKLNDSYVSIFALAILCDIMIFIAVDGYRNNPHEIGKYLSIIFGITVFIICGFEHCVANMYYITVAKAWGGKAIAFLIVNTIGNAVGGVLVPLVRSKVLK